jgi:hypothetical protein
LLIAFTPLEIVKLVRPVQFSKALSPMLVRLPGSVTLFRAVHPKNAPHPRLVTVLGMLTLAR